MKLNSLYFVAASLTLSISCAKERSVEPVADVDEYRFTKADLTEPGVWLTKTTIIQTSAVGGPGSAGFQTDVKAGYFVFEKDKLKFVQAYEEEPTPNLLHNVINSWDVSHSEYRLSESSGNVSNSEQENNYLAWKNKRFFKADLGKADLPSFELSSTCWKEVYRETVPESVEISKERISYNVDATYEFNGDCAISNVRRFVAGYNTSTVRFRVSYIPRKDNESFVPYVFSGSTDPLLKRYGYFVHTVEKRNTENNRLENKFLMQKWDKGTHTFYFAKDYPDDMKWIWNHADHGVMARTNKVFEEHDIDLRFKIEDAPENINYGDLGYSFVKLFPESTVGGLGGYGPSDVDPLTGEVIGAVSNLYNHAQIYYAQIIKDDLTAAAERENPEEGSSLFEKMQERLDGISKDKNWLDTAAPLKFDHAKGSFNTEAGEIFTFLLPEYTYGGFHLYSFGKENIEFETKNIDSISKKIASVEQYLPEASLDLVQSKHKNTLEHIHSYDQLEHGFKIHMPSTLYSVERAAIGASFGKVKGLTLQQMIDNSMYQTSIHEFGHNLNLRHNFYGTVDKRHHPADRPMIDRNGNEIKDTETGEVVMTEVGQSTVMEYQSLDDGMKESWDWGPYDVAALVFAYSDGTKDLGLINKTHYLYCSDEHRNINAMCNTYDRGATPSEVVLSMIESYDNAYKRANYRYDRAYWNASNYDSATLGEMLQLRKFLSFHFETFGSDMETLLSKHPKDFDVENAAELIADDTLKANMLVASFFDAVIRQAAAERPWSNEYDTWTGALKRLGIASDKIYATLFLLGDSALSYNPARSPRPYSYVSLLGQYTDSAQRDTMEQILTDNLTEQPAMEQGFITFGRSLYAQTVTNSEYISNQSLFSNVDMKCVSSATFEKYFGYSPVSFPEVSSEGMFTNTVGEPTEAARGLSDLVTYPIDSVLIKADVVSKLVDPASPLASWLQQSAEIGVVEYAGNYLFASSVSNRYAFDILKGVHETFGSGKETASQYAFQFYRSILAAKGLEFNGTCE